MSNYDGDIKLSMSLDPKDVKQAAKELQNDIKGIFNQSAGKELNSKFKNLEVTMSKTASKAQTLQDKLQKLESQKVPTTEYKEIEKQINDSTAALSKLQERMDKFIETGGKTKSTSFRKMQYDAAQLENTIEYAKAELQDLVDTGKAFTLGSESEDYSRTVQQLAEVNNQMRALTSRADEYTNTSSRMSKVISTLKSAFSGFLKILKSVGSAIVTVTKKLASLAASGIKRGIQGIANAFKNLRSSADKTDKSVGKAIKTLMKYGLGVRSFYFLFRKLRAAIMEGVNNLAQTNGGMNATNQALSSLMSSLNALKNAWGAAFAPVIQTVAPILSKLIDMITGVTNKLAMFLSGMTGKSTAMVSKKTSANYAESLDKTGAASGRKQQEKYDEAVKKANEKYEKQVEKTKKKNADALAKAEEKQAKAADKLAKKQEKANKQLGAYDQLNVIAKEDAEELEDIQATEYEMPELELPDMDDYMTGMTDFDSMFEEVPIDSMIQGLIDKIKEAWNSGDFTDLGNLVGEKLKEKLDAATEWIVNVAQPFASKLGTAIATFTNGLVKADGLAASFGQTLGEVLNTCADFMTGILDNLDFRAVGQFLADGLVSFIETVDWAQIGHNFVAWYNGLFDALGGFAEHWDPNKFAKAVSDFVNTAINDFDWAGNANSLSEFAKKLLDTLSKSLQSIDWQQLGNDVATFIGNIDWAGVASSLFEALGSALGGLAGFLKGLIEDAWNGLVEWWKEVAFEDGQFTIEGLLNGIVDALKNIGKWLLDNVWEPLKKGFMTAFDMHSPSKKMKELGILLMGGLKNGIVERFADIVNKFQELKTKIVAVFNQLKSSVLNTWNQLWAGIKSVINSILGGVERMANGVINGFNRLINGINGLNINIPDWIPEEWGGGHSIGFNIPNLSNVSIPRLAQGAVIPPNKQFLAMLGDQKSGTNVEAPLETIMQALNNVLDAREHSGNKEPIVLQLDGRTVAEVVWDEENKRYKQRGVSYSPIFT